MAETAFDTMDSARKLKSAGIESEHAEALVDFMGQAVSSLVTKEHFNAELRLTREHFNTELRLTKEHFSAELRLTREHFDLTVKRLDDEIAKLSDRIDTGLDSLRTELIARIDTGLAEVHAKIDTGLAELRGRIDAVEKNMWRAQLYSVGVMIGAIALATSILGMMLTRSGGM